MCSRFKTQSDVVLVALAAGPPDSSFQLSGEGGGAGEPVPPQRAAVAHHSSLRLSNVMHTQHGTAPTQIAAEQIRPLFALHFIFHGLKICFGFRLFETLH
jgi:hypothetical protein